MTIEDVIKKSILPLAFMVFWFWMTKTIMKVSGQTDWFWWVFIAGLPFGIHKMRLILIPRGMDTTATLLIPSHNDSDSGTVAELRSCKVKDYIPDMPPLNKTVRFSFDFLCAVMIQILRQINSQVILLHFKFHSFNPFT